MEEEVNKEYTITIGKTTGTTHLNRSKRYGSITANNASYPKVYIYINKNTFEYLGKPKELSFLLGAKGNPVLKFPTIDSKVRSRVIITKEGHYTMSIKNVDDYIAGKYYIELEGDDIILTKVEDERSDS